MNCMKSNKKLNGKKIKVILKANRSNNKEKYEKIFLEKLIIKFNLI